MRRIGFGQGAQSEQVDIVHQIVLGSDLEGRQRQAHHVVRVAGWHSTDCQSGPVAVEVTGRKDLGLTGQFPQSGSQHLGRLLSTEQQMDVDVAVTFDHDAGHRVVENRGDSEVVGRPT